MIRGLSLSLFVSLKAIQAQVAEIKGMTSAEAKEAFLRELSRLETYGSVFFEVKVGLPFC